ncbi:MAG: glycosyltransferase family 2 protein [Rhodobacter sp.]|nr:glycosyltransferase family 2 protein [Rhodobacter sp.]
MVQSLRWGVVGTMDEPAPLILAWVAHHLALGAAEAHVYLDRENAQAKTALAGVPGCFVTVCDDAYWAASSRGARPLRHTARQKYNATDVYLNRSLHWVLQLDADEFLDPVGDFEAELAASAARTLRLRNIERVRRGEGGDIFAGSFRGVIEDDALAEAVHGRWAGFLDAGMAGYHDGKDITRTGEDFTMGVHFPIDAATGQRHTDPYAELTEARILHFDGLTPLHVVLKLLKRANEPAYKVPRKFGTQRMRQFRYVANHVAKPRQLRKMLDGVFGLSDAQARILGAAHLERPFDPRPAMAQLGLAADLSVEAFDTELRDREAALIERTGLLL